MPKKNSKADRALLAKAEDQVKSDDAGSKPVADPDSEPRSAADVAADFGVPVDWALRWLECVEPQADDERKWRTDVFQRRFQGSRKVENERLQLRQQLDELKADMAKQAADFRDALKAKDKQLEKQEALFEEERLKFKEALRSKVIKNVELASSIGEERRAFQKDTQKKDAELGDLRRNVAKLEQALRDKDEECAHRIADLEEERRAFQEDMRKKDAELGELRRNVAKLEQALRDKDGVDAKAPAAAEETAKADEAAKAAATKEQDLIENATIDDEALARQLQADLDAEAQLTVAGDDENANAYDHKDLMEDATIEDEALARQLQADFDAEAEFTVAGVDDDVNTYDRKLASLNAKELAKMIREGQKKNTEFRRRWAKHCDLFASGIKDPKKHKVLFLINFLRDFQGQGASKSASTKTCSSDAV